MTKRREKVEKETFYNICSTCMFSTKYIMDKIKHIRKVMKSKGFKSEAFTGKGLFSMLLPNDFFYEHENGVDPEQPIVKIYKGVLISGTITKANVGNTGKSIIIHLNKDYSKKVACEFIDNIQFMAIAYNQVYGFSVGLGDCIATRTDEIDTEIKKCLIEAEGVEKTTQNAGIREVRIKASLNKARDIGQRIAKEALLPTNNFVSTVTAGSKGDYFNVAQITSLLGQQCVRGERISHMLNHGKRSLPHYILDEPLSVEEKYESKGFISHSFIHGLNPKEFFFHACAGRDGVCDTAMGTANSGYTQRKIAKCTEDITIKYGGAVTDSTGSYIQLVYGSNGYDPAKTVNVNGEPQCCDVSRIVKRLTEKRRK